MLLFSANSAVKSIIAGTEQSPTLGAGVIKLKSIQIQSKWNGCLAIKLLPIMRGGRIICNTQDRRIVASQTLYLHNESIAKLFQIGMLLVRCRVQILHFVQTCLQHAALPFGFLEMIFVSVHLENFRLGKYFQFGPKHVTKSVFIFWKRPRCTFRRRIDRDARNGMVGWNAKDTVLRLARRNMFNMRLRLF